ncbi:MULTISPECIES: class I SAM-dependent RNA methyltransferase [Protofrankia]|uniref:Deoxyribonuclease/rho motif-related TRAM n=1 Tax=Candidatus Protofrankia datiscae TaxID=2716812 RepID=F8B6G2_9ACTN|nr:MULTISPECIES: TRAM domain-containing protein [Protofrankia]AEH09258.1 deoxyribonuclease/rho motif-related TRAM [Candidatus Protofrankia datiscae]
MIEIGSAAEDVIELEIGPVAHGGSCVARDNGRVVFVRHALPGERVRARLTDTSHDRYWRADAVEVLRAAPERVVPPCPHAGAGRCGGCDWQHASLAAQRRLKAAVVREQLRRLAGLDRPVEVEAVNALPPAPSAPTPSTPAPSALPLDALPPDTRSPGEGEGLGWRTRMRYALSGQGEVGLRGHRSHEIVPAADCLIAHPLVRAAVAGRVLPPRDASAAGDASAGGDAGDAGDSDTAVGRAGPRADPRTGIAVQAESVGEISVGEIEVAASVSSGVVVITRLPGTSAGAGAGPASGVPSAAGIPSAAGVPAAVGADSVSGSTAGVSGFDAGVPSGPGAGSEAESEIVEVVRGRRFRLGPGVFWQVHPGAPETLVDAVLTGLAPRAGERALDLYAGAGLFAAALAEAVGPDGTVVAMESDPAAVASAARSLGDLPQVSLRGVRVSPGSLRGLAGTGADIVVLDPPRAGAGRAVMLALLALRPRAVAYVSCDPASLARDLAVAVTQGYSLVTLRAFDLFPMTAHVECVAIMVAPGRGSR